MHNLKTVALLGLMSALVWWLGWWFFGGTSGSFLIGLGFAGALNFFAYFYSDKVALKMSKARPVEEHELPEVYSIVRNLTQRAEMPMPSIHVIDSPQPNAFATGRNPEHSAIAVTTGILQIMNRDELEGVLGHELAHVQNRDILITTIAAMLAAALSIFARMAFWFGGGRDSRDNPIGAIAGLLALLLAPIAAMLIKMAISRSREYQADRSGAQLTGRPLQLASALNKLDAATSRIPMKVDPAVSQLYIADPLKAFKGRGQGMVHMFSTHPPIPERVRRLEEMAYSP